MLCPRVRKGGPWCLLVPYESDFRASSLARLKNLRSFHRAPCSHIMRATVDGRERFRNMAGEMTCASQKYADHGSGSCPGGLVVFPFPGFPGFPLVSPSFLSGFPLVFPWFCLGFPLVQEQQKTRERLKENQRKTKRKLEKN